MLISVYSCVGIKTKSYQEDTYSVESILIARSALKKNVINVKGGAGGGAGWSPQTLEGYIGEDQVEGGKKPKRQVAFFGVYDG